MDKLLSSINLDASLDPEEEKVRELKMKEKFLARFGAGQRLADESGTDESGDMEADVEEEDSALNSTQASGKFQVTYLPKCCCLPLLCTFPNSGIRLLGIFQLFKHVELRRVRWVITEGTM